MRCSCSLGSFHPFGSEFARFWSVFHLFSPLLSRKAVSSVPGRGEGSSFWSGWASQDLSDEALGYQRGPGQIQVLVCCLIRRVLCFACLLGRIMEFEQLCSSWSCSPSLAVLKFSYYCSSVHLSCTVSFFLQIHRSVWLIRWKMYFVHSGISHLLCSISTYDFKLQDKIWKQKRFGFQKLVSVFW